MSITSKLVCACLVLALGCFGLAFYFSKYQKEPFAIVEFTSDGCFHHESYRLSLISDGDSTKVSLDSTGNVLKQARISKRQLDTFNIFVKELKQLNNGGGCTNYDFYKLTDRNRIIERADGNCDWYGFRRLIFCFFKTSL